MGAKDDQFDRQMTVSNGFLHVPVRLITSMKSEFGVMKAGRVRLVVSTTHEIQGFVDEALGKLVSSGEADSRLLNELED